MCRTLQRYKIFAINAIRAALSPGFWRLAFFFSAEGALWRRFGMFWDDFLFLGCFFAKCNCRFGLVVRTWLFFLGGLIA